MAGTWTTQYRARRGDSHEIRLGMGEMRLFSAVAVSFKIALGKIKQQKQKHQNQSRCRARFKVADRSLFWV